MPVLFCDFETRSSLQLPDCGAWKYAGDASTDVWCVAYAIDAEPVQVWLPGQPIPKEFQIAVSDPAWLIVARNDSFERAIEERLLGPRYGWPIIPIERHRCTQAMALAAALPAKLETVAEALQLSFSKDAEGHRLMLQMSRPRKPRSGEPAGIYWIDDPEKLRRLIVYCARDVSSLSASFTSACHRYPIPNRSIGNSMSASTGVASTSIFRWPKPSASLLPSAAPASMRNWPN
jgi:DNA polymerase